MPKTQAFDEYTDEYDAWYDKNLDSYEAELKALRELIPGPSSDGLEVGVGSGKFASPLNIKTGVEPSERMAAKARKRGIKVYPGVGEDLPFLADRFDFVLFSTTLCFLDDVLKAFKEAHRVLKPHGCVVIGFIDKQSELGKKYDEKRNKSRFYKDANFISTKEVLEHLNKAGFKVEIIRQTLIPGEEPKTVLDGYGKGAFVVIKAVAG